MTTLRLKPKRSGFFRPFGCGWFIREVPAGDVPYGSPVIMPAIDASQADIFRHYKLDRSTKLEEKKTRREKRLISPEKIEGVTERFLARMPYKAWGCRYHSFVSYVSSIRKLGWIEPTGQVEPSALQSNKQSGQPHKYYRLTVTCKGYPDSAWANPFVALHTGH